jgi:hypothetical protein
MGARLADQDPPGAPAGDDAPSSARPVTGREARHPVLGARRVADMVATIALLAIATLVAVTAGWGIVFLSLAFHSCVAPGNRCDETLGGFVVYAGPVVVALILVLAVVFSVLRLVRRHLAWPIAAIGLVAIVAVFFAALLLVDSAVTHGI